MARFYLDHDVKNRLAQLLNERGHNATTALAEHSTRLRDGAHLMAAAQSARIIITHNKKDFIELHHAWILWTSVWNVAERHGGVVIIPQNDDWDLYRIVGELEGLLETNDSCDGRLFRWTASSGWLEE